MAQSYTIDQAAAQISRDNAPWFSLANNNRTINYTWLDSAPSYNSSFSAFSSAQQTAAHRAMELWSDIANFDINYVADDSLAQVRFGVDTASNGAAYAYLPSSSSTYDGDVWMVGSYNPVNGGVGTAATPTYGGYGFMVFLHEVGHALGLMHPGNYNGSGSYSNDALYAEDTQQYSLMSYFSASNTGAIHNGRASTPLLHDVAAIQRLYGANMSTRTGDDTYGFNNTTNRDAFDFTKNTNPIVTIWDAGGNDTLDLSGFSTKSNIDLRDGHFSDAANMTKNISIAKNAIIENAIGGSGNDTFRGNNVNNKLEGNGGNDLFIASSGHDTVDGGSGTDTIQLSGASTEYKAEYRSGNSGPIVLSSLLNNDKITFENVENLTFSDKSVAVSTFMTSSSTDRLVYVRGEEFTEGNSDNVIKLKVHVNETDTTNDITFDYVIKSGTATLGTDFTIANANGQGTIAKGKDYAEIAVTLKGDTHRESNETFSIEISNVKSSGDAKLSSNNTATMTINNDDTQIQDDYANTYADVIDTSSGLDAGVITLTSDKGSITGELEKRGDYDWFKVSLDAGTSYVIDLMGNGSNNGTLRDTYLHVYDNAGKLVTFNDDSGTALDSRVFLDTSGSSGTVDYYLKASAYANYWSGTYKVSVAKRTTDTSKDDYADSYADATDGSNPVAGTITLDSKGNGSASGDLETQGDRDWFKVDLAANTTYKIALTGADTEGLRDTFLRVYDSKGNKLKFNDDGGTGFNSQLTIENASSSAGTYYISAASYGDYFKGKYDVSVQKLADDAIGHTTSTASTSDLTVGGSYNGTLEHQGDRDWFKVDLTANKSYVISLDGVGSDGVHDTYLKLYDSSGTLIKSDDDGGNFLNSKLTYDVGSTNATVYVEASSYANYYSGDYKVTLRENTDAGGNSETTSKNSGTLTIGTATEGELEERGDRDLYKVSLIQGQTYRLTLEGKGGSNEEVRDTYLRLYKSDGTTLISQNDDYGNSFDSRLRYTADTTGDYYVSAGAFADSHAGKYSLLVESLAGGSNDDYANSTATAGVITLKNNEGSIKAELEEREDSDWFKLDVTKGKTYEVNMIGGRGSDDLRDAYLTLRKSDGSQIGRDDDSGYGLNAKMTYTATADGHIYIDASSYADMYTGKYNITVKETQGAAVSNDDYASTYAIASDTDASTTAPGTVDMRTVYSAAYRYGELETIGDRDFFKLTLEGGEWYTIQLSGLFGGTLSDTYLRLYDSSGTLIGQNDDVYGYKAASQLSVDLRGKADGTYTYYAEASAFNDLYAGSYRVSVVEHYSWYSTTDDGKTTAHYAHDEGCQCAGCANHGLAGAQNDDNNDEEEKGEKDDSDAQAAQAIGQSSSGKTLYVVRTDDSLSLSDDDFSYIMSEDRNINLNTGQLRIIDGNGVVIVPSDINYVADMTLSGLNQNASGADIRSAIASNLSSNTSTGEASFMRITFADNTKATVFYFNGDETAGQSDSIGFYDELNDTQWSELQARSNVFDDGSGKGSRYSFTVQDSVREGDEDVTLTVTVTRAGDTDTASAVDYSVTGIGDHAADVNDFNHDNQMPSGIVRFAEGETTKTFTITIAGDENLERNEDFRISLAPRDDDDTIVAGNAHKDVTILTDERPEAGHVNYGSGSANANLFVLGDDISNELRGGSGDDIYVLSRHHQTDTNIYDQVGTNKLVFDYGVNIDSIRTLAFGSKLEIKLTNDYTVTLHAGYQNFNYYIGNSSAVTYNQLVSTYGSGTRVNTYYDQSALSLSSSSNNFTNYISGDALDNVFVASGSQSLEMRGGGGDDRYVISRFFTGNDIKIIDASTDDSDVIVLDQGVNVSSTSLNSLTGTLTINLSGGGTVIVNNASQFTYQYGDEAAQSLNDFRNPAAQPTVDPTPQSAVRTLGDGSNAITGTSNDDNLYGKEDETDYISTHGGNDTLEGRSGNDYLTGGDGADRFVFDIGLDSDGDILWQDENGMDVILDFDSSEGDKIVIRSNNSQLDSLDDLRLFFNDDDSGFSASVNGNNLVINFNDGGRLTLSDQNINSNLYDANNNINNYDDFLAAIGNNIEFI